ncbi:TolC family protein, partial [Acinetobacter baumannii]
SGAAQTLEVGAAPIPEWWHSFASPKLDALVDRALKHNSDLAVADATLRQARELAKAAAGAQGLQVDASYAAQGLRASGTFSPPLNDPNAYL